MSFLKKASVLTAVFAGLAGFNPDFARAEGFALQDWSARGAALAGGVVARGGDAAAVAYNPAAITELEGTQVMIGGELISLTNTIISKSGVESESNSKLYVSPHGYITHKLNDKISLGFGLYSRYGLGNDHGEWFGRAAMKNIELMTLSATPVVAWRVTDKLSLAAGLEIMGGLVEYNKSASSLMGGIGNAKLEGDAVNYGFNLSAHYRFNEQWKAGFVYRSHVTVDFEGDLTVSGVPLSGMNGKYDGKAALHTPDSYTFALAYYPTENLSFEGQVQYNTWSRYHSLEIITALNTDYQAKEWNDTWLFSLSAEYDWNEWLTLRAGASYETSPIDEKHADFIAPVNGRWKYAAGFGVHKDRWSVDVSYVFHDITNLYYDQSIELSGAAIQTKDVYAHTVGLSLGYKF